MMIIIKEDADVYPGVTITTKAITLRFSPPETHTLTLTRQAGQNKFADYDSVKCLVDSAMTLDTIYLVRLVMMLAIAMLMVVAMVMVMILVRMVATMMLVNMPLMIIMMTNMRDGNENDDNYDGGGEASKHLCGVSWFHAKTNHWTLTVSVSFGHVGGILKMDLTLAGADLTLHDQLHRYHVPKLAGAVSNCWGL